MRENLQAMPQIELQVYGKAILEAYNLGGDHFVMGGQMSRHEIVVELKAILQELRERSNRHQ